MIRPILINEKMWQNPHISKYKLKSLPYYWSQGNSSKTNSYLHLYTFPTETVYIYYRVLERYNEIILYFRISELEFVKKWITLDLSDFCHNNNNYTLYFEPNHALWNRVSLTKRCYFYTKIC